LDLNSISSLLSETENIRAIVHINSKYKVKKGISSPETYSSIVTI